jgi:membrane associated rhomboid family serine protease
VIPIGDSPRRRITPWVTYAIILVNIGVWVYMLTLDFDLTDNRAEARQELAEQTAGVCYGFTTRPTELDRYICTWGFQPAEFLDTVRGQADPEPSTVAVLFSIISSIFLHAGWLHIIGNMLFLWVFGDNVEDRLGHIGFLIFYLLAGIVASLAQAFINVDSVVPVVGASGAVAGVLGAYLVYYPKATVNVVIPFFILIFIPIPIPAVVMIGFWFLQNLLAGIATIYDPAAPDHGVAFFAHIGGFLFGALTVLLFLRRAGRRPPRWQE